MWLKSQNFDKPIHDKGSHTWHFSVWLYFVDCVEIQRIYFWVEDRNEIGMMEFTGDQSLNVRQLKSRIDKLVANPD